MMLMCKNTPVYDIEKEKTLNYNLLPGLMQQKGADNHTFTKWMKYRYSSGTNTIARKLKGITFGQGARMRINRETRALSFIDCYWIKAEDDSICFEEISPYYKPFWDGNEEFTGQAAPTLYVGGALSKEWKRKQLVPDTINNGRDRHRTKNYAAFSTSNFQICRICGKSRSISQCFSLFLGLLGSLTTTRPSESMPVRTMKCPL